MYRPSTPLDTISDHSESIESNTLLIGDALEILPHIPDHSIQAVIADPPYFNVLPHAWDRQWDTMEAYLDWSCCWLRECMRLLREDGLLFCFGQLGKREHGFLHLMSRVCCLFDYHDLIIWDRVVGYDRRDSFSPAYEMILVLRKSNKVKFIKDAVRHPYDTNTIKSYLKDKRYKDHAARLASLQQGKYATNILRIPSLKGHGKEKCGHPSQKPLALIDKLILCSTDPGDVVCDPFLGSGTTALAAQKNGRAWIGIEKNNAYAALAQQRILHCGKEHARILRVITQGESRVIPTTTRQKNE